MHPDINITYDINIYNQTFARGCDVKMGGVPKVAIAAYVRFLAAATHSHKNAQSGAMTCFLYIRGQEISIICW